MRPRATPGAARRPWLVERGTVTNERVETAEGRQPEGLAWLGREPEVRAGPGYRLLLGLGRAALRALGLRLRVEGLERLPPGSYILAAAIHRSWIDPLILLLVWPASPRSWFIGSAETTLRSRPRGWIVRRLGGFLPVWRGGTDLGPHIAGATAVLRRGGVFAVFPEGSRRGGTFRVEPLRRGTALIGLRTGAPIVPVALAGTRELYRGRRIAIRVLPATSGLELAGLASPPDPGSAAEVGALHAASDALRATLAPHVEELASWCEDPPTVPRPWSWLSRVIA
jgi:1-acyl-sn-glycerol-3-phosphate acyltransferase